MPHSTVTHRYAEALFDLAQQQGALEPIEQGLAGLSQILTENPQLVTLWKSPVVALADKKDLARQLLAGRVEPILLHTLYLMLDHKRGSDIPGLYEAFHARYDALRRRRKAHVTTPLPLSSAEAALLVQELARATAFEIDLETAIDPDLIGGIVVTLGDKVIDYSLKGRVESLVRNLV